MTEQKQNLQKESIGQAFSKSELLKAERYQDKKDLIQALLQDHGNYTLKEVDAKINQFMKGKVK